MTVAVLVRRFLADYARNPVNVLMLFLVPVAFVIVAAGSLADSAALIGGGTGGSAVETSTAGWAAAFLSGIAMYFQVSASRQADRRLVIAGLPSSRLVVARLVVGLALALLASSAALLALAARTGIDDPGRVAAGTLMFALIYLAIGAVIGALVRTPVNGTVLVLFVFIMDVFFGPTLTASDRVATWVLPTHFVTLWMVDLPSGHGGSPGDLGWSVAWCVVATVTAFAVVVSATRVARRGRRGPDPGSIRAQLAASVLMGWRAWRRNPVLWVLLAVVPAVFILLADAITPPGSMAVEVTEGGRRLTEAFDPASIHAGTMAPIAIASLATLVGLFIGLDARGSDERLALAGMRPSVLLAARTAMVVLAALVSAAVGLAVAAIVFTPVQWGTYAAGNALIGITYGFVGVLIGPAFGRVSGVFVAFLLPFIDLGLGQSPMLQGERPWARFMPGYAGARVMTDGALTPTFDGGPDLLLAAAWVVGLALVAAALLRVRSRVPRTTGRPVASAA